MKGLPHNRSDPSIERNEQCSLHSSVSLYMCDCAAQIML